MRSTDLESGTPLIFGFYLRSAINLHLLSEEAEYEANSIANKTGGIKFIEDPMSEEGLEKLLTCEAAIVADTDLVALYAKLKAKEKLEDEKEKEKWKYISLKVVL